MAKAVARAGYGPQAGALNPRITFSEDAPVSPRTKDIWINTLYNTEQYWNGIEWVVLSGITTAPGIYSSVGLPLIIITPITVRDIAQFITDTTGPTVDLLDDIDAPITVTEAVSTDVSSFITDDSTITILIV